jgi:PAS domain S-box-containing protein
MSKNSMWPSKYAWTLGLCGFAFMVGSLLDAPSSSFMLVVMAVSLYAGRGPSVVAIITSSCIFEFYFLPPRGHLLHSEKELLRLTVFVGTVILAAVMIEARRRSEEATARVGREFRSLAETSPDCILFMNAGGCIDFANPVTEKMFGYPVTELRGKPVSLLLLDLDKRTSPVGEFLAVRRDGQSFYVESACGKLGDKTTIFLRDITDRKAATRKIEETERSLRLTLETIPGLVFTRSSDGQIEYVNGGLSSFTGSRPKGVTEDAWIESLHPDEKEEVLSRSAKYIQLGQAFVMEYRRRRHDGVYRQSQTRVQPLLGPKGEVIRWYGLVTDIDERYEAEESLKRTQAKLAHAMQVATAAELAASIVHEISQPLSAMVANGQASLRWLSAIPPNYADGRLAVERIVRDGKDAAGIIKGVRALFGRAPLVKVPVDLCDLLVEIISLSKAKAEQEGVVIELDMTGDEPKIMGDKIQLQQVIMNLLNNGIDSMRLSTKLSKKLLVRLVQEPEHLTVSVEDQGTGPENYDSIFEAFVTTKEDGMGMGLAICRSIVQIHNGELWGRSSQLGGSIFSFKLPHIGMNPQ